MVVLSSRRETSCCAVHFRTVGKGLLCFVGGIVA